MFKVWYHENKSLAEYIIEITKLNEHDPDIEKISLGRNFADNPDMIQKILYLDMPDAVVTYGFSEKPVLGIEFCAEAPSGHDIFQRMARVVASASFGTAFAFIFPEKKWVVRRGGGRWDNYNPLPLRALMSISRFHKVPALSFFWEANQLSGEQAEGFLMVDETIQICLIEQVQKCRVLQSSLILPLTMCFKIEILKKYDVSPIYHGARSMDVGKIS